MIDLVRRDMRLSSNGKDTRPITEECGFESYKTYQILEGSHSGLLALLGKQMVV